MLPYLGSLTRLLPLLLITSTTLPIASVTAYAPLSDTTLRALPPPTDSDFNIKTGALLAPILIPRVPGTPNSLKVLQHFTDFFTHTLPSWKISYDNSTSKTPLSKGKEVPFSNFYATRDPPWAREGEVGRLVLVAHYDSKIHPEGFIGATDSAAPCAMLMHVAKAIDGALTRKWEKMAEAKKMESGSGRVKDEHDAKDDLGDDDDEGKVAADEVVRMAENRGVMILLLDGEEAFENWSDTDSLYGARNLASTWDTTYHPASSSRRTALSSIDLFVLLDLLGSQSPRVPSYFPTTHWAYRSMSTLEHRLRSLSPALLTTGPSSQSRKNNFLPEHEKKPGQFLSWGVQDDHIPFLHRGVEVLHLIPTPFPRVWHEMDDDGEHLHIPTVLDWAMLTTAFVAEYLELEGCFIEGGKEEAKVEGDGGVKEHEIPPVDPALKDVGNSGRKLRKRGVDVEETPVADAQWTMKTEL